MSGKQAKCGDVIIVKDLERKKTFEFDLVPPEEAKGLTGKLSITSPLGSVLIGSKKGSTVEVRIPAGVRNFEVIKIIDKNIAQTQ